MSYLYSLEKTLIDFRDSKSANKYSRLNDIISEGVKYLEAIGFTIIYDLGLTELKKEHL